MVLHLLQHHLSSLHVMALAGRLWTPRGTALTLARWWERAGAPRAVPGPPAARLPSGAVLRASRAQIPAFSVAPRARHPGGAPNARRLPMNDVLAQRILEFIFRDSAVRRMHKDTLSDWILDTPPTSGTATSAPRPGSGPGRPHQPAEQHRDADGRAGHAVPRAEVRPGVREDGPPRRRGRTRSRNDRPRESLRVFWEDKLTTATRQSASRVSGLPDSLRRGAPAVDSSHVAPS